MAITTIINYDVNGNQDITLELTDYNDTNNTITDFRYADAYNGLANWFTFSSVVIEEPSATDVSNGYGGYKKLVGFGRSGDGANMIFFISPLSDLDDSQPVTMDMLLLAGDWSSLWYTSGFVNATYSGTLTAHYLFNDLTSEINSYDLTTFDGASVSGGVMTFPNASGGMKPSSKIPLASEFTVSLWFKDLKDRSSAQANFLMFTGNRGTQNDYLFCVYHNDELGAYKGGMISSGYSMTHLTHSGWHHLVAAYDNGTLTFYVDGAQAGNSISYANSGEIELFGSFDGGYQYAPADEMDNIRVYSKVLTAQEISDLYTAEQPAVPTPETTLEGQWSFDSDATDSANGYNGTVTAGSFESAAGRDFISFERESTGIVSLPDSLDSIVAGDYTMSAWVRLDTLQDTDFGYFGVMTINGVGLSVTLGYPSVTSNGGNTTNHFLGVGLMSVDTWHHLVLVQEGSDSKLYLDGVLLGTNPTQPSNAWGIGTDNTVAKGYSPFGGDIDDLRIYSMALDADMVNDLYIATTVAAPTPETTLVGHWSFDNGDATADVGPDGTATGASFGTEDGRTVLQYDGSGDYVTVPYNEALVPQEAITVATWIKFDEAGNQYDFPIFAGGSGGSGNEYSYSIWRFRSEMGGALAHQAGMLSWRVKTSNGVVSATAQVPVVGEWYHVVGTYDGSEMKMYINGALAVTEAQTGLITRFAGQPLYFGQQSNYPQSGTTLGGAMHGAQDDVRIYSMALSASQVSDLHTATAPVPTPETTLIGQWSFDSDGSPTVGSETFAAANGATFASDSGRDAAYFPNANSGFYNNSYIDLPDDYTLSFWFKDLKSRASAQSNFLMAVAYNKETNGAGGYSNWDYDTSYDVAIYTNDELGAYGYANTSAGSNTHNSTGHQMTQALYNGTGWHHMAVVHENGQSTYYINGVQVGVPVSTTGMDKIQTIGSYTNFNYGAFDYMDDFRVYSMAFNADQVAALHTETTVVAPATPIQKNGYYPLYEDESDANGHAGGNGTSHSHQFDGVTYHMPNGLVMGVTQFHGNYGLIAKYALDNNSDDSVGTNNLSLVGGSVSYVGYGTNQDAVEFDFGELESDNVVDLTGEFTISFWAKEGTPHVYYSNNYSSFFKYGTTGSYFDLYLLNGKIRTMHNNAAAGWGDNRGSVAVPAGWNHYAMTIDPSTGSKIVYLNGVAQALTGPAFTGTFASSQKIHIGNVSTDPAFRSNGGQMDDVRIWDRVLEASEIATIAAEGADETTVVAEELIGHWNFDNGDLSAVVGSAGTNDGASFVTLADRTAVSIPYGVYSPLQAGGRVRWDNGGFDFTTEDFSVALWIYNTPSAASWPQTIGNLSFGNSAEPYGWSFGKYDTSETLFSAQSADGTANGWSNTHLQQFEIPLYKWTHVVLTRVGTEFKVYLNGADSGYTGVAHSSIVHQSGDDFMTLGMSTDETWSASSGVYDDIRVYNYALDASEASSLYSSTLVATPSGDSVDVSVFSSDTYGDTWNNGEVEVRDANGNQVQVFTGPASGVQHPDGLSETMSLVADQPYTYIVTPGGYPSEIAMTISDSSGNLLVSMTGNSGTGAFYAPSVPQDSTSPVITILGDNPMSLTVGDSFTDPGATAVDDVDGAVSVSVSGQDSISVSDDWVAYSGYNMSAPTIDGEMLISGGSFGHNYLARKENDIADQADFEVVVEFEDVTLPWTQYEPELRLRVDFLDNAYSAEIKMQAYSAWGANNTFFSGFRQQHNSGQTYSGQTSGGSLVQNGAFKVVRVGSTVTMYRREGDGEFVQMSSATSANYSGSARIIVAFQNTPGKITSVSRTDIATGAQEGTHVITYTAQDAAGNVATATREVSVAAAVTGYDWTHGGQLTNIVKFSRGVDALGNPSFAYAKKEDDNTATLYLTTDIQDFAQFSSNATGATGIVGSPVCMEYGPGKLFMGTSTGNAYEIEFNGNTITSVLELHAMAGGESVREAKYDSIQNQWIFEAGEKIFTVVPGTTTAVERYVLPSGAKCMDIAAGDSGVAIIIKRADHSLAPIIATAGWTEIASEEAMVASLNSIGVADFNYDYVMDKWVAASASGQILQADDLLQFLGGSGSPPLPG